MVNIPDSPLVETFLASLLYQPHLVHSVNLPEHALRGLPARIFKAIHTLAVADEPVNTLAIQDELTGVDPGGYTAYVQQLLDAPVVNSLDSCVNSILDVYERRQAVEAAQRLVQAAVNQGYNIAEAKAEVAGKLLRGFTTQSVISAASLLDQDITQVEQWAAAPLAGHNVRGIPTGLRNMDTVLDGLWPGLMIIAGRPSMGKTAVGIRMARGVAGNKPVLYCTFENSPEVIRRRMACALAGMDIRRVRRGLSEDELERYKYASKQLAALPISFYNGDRTLTSVSAVINQEYHRHGDLGLVVLDNLGHVRTGEEMYQERGTVCKAMLALAGRLGVPVLALNQINRAPDARAEKRPTLADLADSGQIEQDADIVGLLYRDDYYNANTETPNVVELGIMKNRLNGNTGPVFLYRNRITGDIGDAATKLD